MAGSGYKLYLTGDVLSATDVNNYLQEQTVMVFASSAARTSALSLVLAEGMVSYLQDTNTVQVYNGSAWVAVGGSSPLTTKGDLYGYSTLDARIPIGTNNQVLTADSAQALGLKWATPSTGALTKIASTSFSSVASQAFDSVFSATYKTYFIAIEYLYSVTYTDDLLLQFRYSGSTETGSTYNGSDIYARFDGTTVTNYNTNAETALKLSRVSGTSVSPLSGFFYAQRVGNASQKAVVTGMSYEISDLESNSFNGTTTAARTYDGFLLKSGSSNITGQVAIYGVQA